MKKLTLPLFAIALFFAGIFIAKGGDNKAAAPAKDAKAEKEKQILCNMQISLQILKTTRFKIRQMKLC